MLRLIMMMIIKYGIIIIRIKRKKQKSTKKFNYFVINGFPFSLNCLATIDFANVLNYAKFFSSSEFAKDLCNSKFQISDFKLPTPLSWRFEVTNGY